METQLMIMNIIEPGRTGRIRSSWVISYKKEKDIWTSKISSKSFRERRSYISFCSKFDV